MAVVTGLLRAVLVVAVAAGGVAALLLGLPSPPAPAPAGMPAAAGPAVLRPAQIARHAHGAGFRGDGLVVAVAVALAESSGNPRAHNPTPPDDSYGLWQINMHGQLGPDRRQRYGLASNRDLVDPAVNARIAYALSGGGRNWAPWATYTSGAYRRHLDRATTAARAVQAGAP